MKDQSSQQGAHEFIDVIRQLIGQETYNENKTVTCEIESVNQDGSLNVYILPDKGTVIKNVINQCRFEFSPGDQATLFKIDNKTNNSFIIAKHNPRSDEGKPQKITVDKALSLSSENPVQNSAVSRALRNKQDALVSGDNIATINGVSLLDGGNIAVTATGTLEAGAGIEITQTGSNDVYTIAVSDDFVANSAVKLNTDAGSTDHPVYFDGGKPKATQYRLVLASNNEPGLIRTNYANQGKNYKVEVTSSGNAYVNVPWGETTASYDTLGSIKLGSNTVQTVTTNSPSAIVGRTYPVQLDANQHAVVNVPWEEGGDIAEGALAITFNFTSSTYVHLNIDSLTGKSVINWGDGVVNSNYTWHNYASGYYTCYIYGVTQITGDIFDTTNYAEESVANKATITKVIVPDTVTNIAEGVFNGYSYLVEIDLPFIGSSASLTSSTSNKEILFGYIFGTSSYTNSLSILQYYSNNGYYNSRLPASLTKVVVGNKGVLKRSFCSTNNAATILSVTTPNIETIILKNGITNIYENVFENCYKLKNIIIPDSVISIGNNAFKGYSNTVGNCMTLESVTLSSNLQEIGDTAFLYCPNLTSVYYNGTPAQFNAITISSTGNANFTSAHRYYKWYDVDSSIDVNSTNVVENKAVAAALNAKQDKFTSGEIVLDSNSWDDKAYDYSFSGISSNDTLLLTPKTRVDKTNANNADLFCTISAGHLYFTAENTPSVNITFLYSKFGG